MNRTIPRLPLWLGLGGLVPFWVAGIGIWVVASREWAFFLLHAQMAYAAVITSFLGAVHWGVVLGRAAALAEPRLDPPAPTMLVWGVAPALMAWAIILVTPFLGIVWLGPLLMIVLLAMAYFADIQVGNAGLVPPWYLRLRKILTIGAQTAVALGLAATL